MVPSEVSRRSLFVPVAKGYRWQQGEKKKRMGILLRDLNQTALLLTRYWAPVVDRRPLLL